MKRLPLLLLILAVGALGCEKPRTEQELAFSGGTMGTSYSVRISSELKEGGRQRWQERVQECLDDINARMSTYQPDSEVSRFNRTAGAEWFPVSEDVAMLVSEARKISRQTEGAFDITVGPLVNLWSFGPDRRPNEVPAESEIDAARAMVGYEYLEAQLDPPALRKKIPELAIDLSAIAKGYAVDRVGELLESEGVQAYMVEIGGEVRTRGRKRDGSRWRIGIERPVTGQRLLQSVLTLEDYCLATSGDYRIGFMADGQWYSHEIDPRTGYPVAHGVASVSVLASSVMLADAYATGLMIMPHEDALRLAKEQGLEIMVLMRDGDGDLSEKISPGFARLVSKR